MSGLTNARSAAKRGRMRRGYCRGIANFGPKMCEKWQVSRLLGENLRNYGNIAPKRGECKGILNVRIKKKARKRFIIKRLRAWTFKPGWWQLVIRPQPQGDQGAIPALMIGMNVSTLRQAPPTSAPSISGCPRSSTAFSGFTLPPYCITTRAAVSAEYSVVTS